MMTITLALHSTETILHDQKDAERQRHAHSTRHSAEGFCCVAGLPAVVTLAPQATDKTYDGVPMGEACRQLEQLGADVVGLNCHRGPRTTLPLMEEVRRACKVNVKGLFLLFSFFLYTSTPARLT